MTPERQELVRLESEGNYVFHGTGDNLDTLEPRQAIDTKTGPDGPPAIFASDRADYAIFMAIVNRHNCPNGSQSGAGGHSSDGVTTELRFRMTKDTADQLQDSASGFVYVFPKADFEQRDFAAEYFSTKSLVPLRKIRVRKEDLPKGIEVYDA